MATTQRPRLQGMAHLLLAVGVFLELGGVTMVWLFRTGPEQNVTEPGEVHRLLTLFFVGGCLCGGTGSMILLHGWSLLAKRK